MPHASTSCFGLNGQARVWNSRECSPDGAAGCNNLMRGSSAEGPCYHMWHWERKLWRKLFTHIHTISTSWQELFHTPTDEVSPWICSSFICLFSSSPLAFTLSLILRTLCTFILPLCFLILNLETCAWLNYWQCNFSQLLWIDVTAALFGPGLFIAVQRPHY